jgi:hypothetical protein
MGERVLKQRSIFDALQQRLLEAIENVISDAEYLKDLSEAVMAAADTLETLEQAEAAETY